MVYIITISFIFIVSIVTIVIEGGTIGGTIDFPSMFVIVSTISMILVASNSWRDFYRAFKIVVSKKNYPALQIAHSMNSVSLVIDSLLCSCGMIVFLCLAMVINFSGDTQSWGVILALGLLTIFYTGEILLILYPLKSILYKKLSFLKKSPVQEIFVFSSIPFKPILVFFIGLLVLFLLLTIEHTFVFSDFSIRVLSFVPFIIFFLLGSSYLFLFPSKLFLPYLTALRIAFKTSSSETLQQLSESRRALNFVILVRFALSFFGGVLITINILGSLGSAVDIPLRFPIPLLLIAVSFLSALFLVIVRSRIDKTVSFRIYGGQEVPTC